MFQSFCKLVTKLTQLSSYQTSLQADSILSLSGPPISENVRQTYELIETHENNLRGLALACATRLRSMKLDELDTLRKVDMYLDARETGTSPRGTSLQRLESWVLIKQPQLQTQLWLLNQILDSFDSTLSTLGELGDSEASRNPENASPRLAQGSGRALVAMIDEAKGLRDRIQEGLAADSRIHSSSQAASPFCKFLDRYQRLLKDPVLHTQFCPNQGLIDKFETWNP